MVEKGDVAPRFTLDSDEGERVSLSDFEGRRVVLYFYPKDNTPGCTTQACDLRDEVPSFEAVDAVILGVSPDSVASHRKFKAKYRLNFTLLADTEHEVAEAYGVWQQKSMFGRKYHGIVRSTFLIGTDGRIEEVWRRVSPRGHAELLTERLRDG
jgi:peroxiredoxin Q/BCP